MELKIILLIHLLVYIAIATSDPYQDNDPDYLFDEADGGNDEIAPRLPGYNLNIPQLDPADCQFKTIKKCNQKFKSMFNGANLRAASNDKELYCKGIQVFMDCLEETDCRGTFIDNYSYVILQHGMMDRKTHYCPHHSYGKLVNKVKAIISKHRFIDDIGADSSSACSANVHIKCASTLTNRMKTDSNMCKDIQTFIDCYKQESPKCHSNLIQHFAHLCGKLGESMLKANEKHKGMMC